MATSEECATFTEMVNSQVQLPDLFKYLKSAQTDEVWIDIQAGFRGLDTLMDKFPRPNKESDQEPDEESDREPDEESDQEPDEESDQEPDEESDREPDEESDQGINLYTMIEPGVIDTSDLADQFISYIDKLVIPDELWVSFASIGAAIVLYGNEMNINDETIEHLTDVYKMDLGLQRYKIRVIFCLNQIIQLNPNFQLPPQALLLKFVSMLAHTTHGRWTFMVEETAEVMKSQFSFPYQTDAVSN